MPLVEHTGGMTSLCCICARVVCKMVQHLRNWPVCATLPQPMQITFLGRKKQLRGSLADQAGYSWQAVMAATLRRPVYAFTNLFVFVKRVPPQLLLEIVIYFVKVESRRRSAARSLVVVAHVQAVLIAHAGA